MFEQSKVQSCDECDARIEDAVQAKETLCPDCPRSKKITDPYFLHLLHYLKLQNSGCPVGRHELLDEEWIMLGQMKSSWEKFEFEWMKNSHKERTD